MRVCKRWRNSLEAFISDMGPRPSPEHSIDRKDNNGNYTPDNCQWATRSQQARNKRNSTLLTLGGVTKQIDYWAEECGIRSCTIRDRLKAGWSIKRALTVQPKTV